MSAVDFTARAMAGAALGGAGSAPPAGNCLFTQLPVQRPHPASARLETTGHGVAGRGAGSYVNDALCTPALLATHPRFAVKVADGRIFRFLPIDNGVTVEQAGAVGDGIANDQPAIQAAIAYAEALGIGEVRFTAKHYAVWATQRTSPAFQTMATDGHPIVVRKSMRLSGTASQRTTLDFRAIDGGNPETAFQTVATSAGDATPMVWRGGGIFVLGDYPSRSNLSVDRIAISRLVLKGNRLRTGSHAWPASTDTGDGWDTSDKAFWIQDTFVGDVEISDVDMIGWKGEIFYLGGYAPRSLKLERTRLLTSNGSAFNPGVNVPLRATDCEFGDCFQAQEETGKHDAVYINCVWRDCDHMSLGSGPAAAAQYSLRFPTRDEATQPPRTILQECEFRNVNMLYLASWVRGSIRLVDTQLIFDGNMLERLRDVDLDIDAVLDQRNQISPCILYGPSTLTTQVDGAPAGVYREPPVNVQLRLRQSRTALARKQGREWRGFTWSGYIDPSCSITVDNAEVFGTLTPNGGNNPISMPQVNLRGHRFSNAFTSHGAFTYPYFEAAQDIVINGPMIAVGLTGNQSLDMGISRYPAGGPDFGYVEGQTVRIFKNEGNGKIVFRRNAPGGGYLVKRDRVLDAAHDWIEFTYNRLIFRWEESNFFTSVDNEFAATIASQSLPLVQAGKIATIDLIVVGARIGDEAHVRTELQIPGLITDAQVVMDNTVRFRLFNPGTSDFAATSSKVYVTVRRY